MAYRIEVTKQADKAIAKLDPPIRKRVIKFLQEIPLDDPWAVGCALNGVLREFWKYRMGDYRIIAKIESERLVILVVDVGHRSDIYRG